MHLTKRWLFAVAERVPFGAVDGRSVWLSITDAEAQEKFGKSAGELKGECEVYGSKLILSDYYNTTFKMEDRAIGRLTDLNEFWMPYVDSAGKLESAQVHYIFNNAAYIKKREPAWRKTGVAGGSMLFDGCSTYVDYSSDAIWVISVLGGCVSRLEGGGMADTLGG